MRQADLIIRNTDNPKLAEWIIGGKRPDKFPGEDLARVLLLVILRLPKGD